MLSQAFIPQTSRALSTRNYGQRGMKETMKKRYVLLGMPMVAALVATGPAGAAPGSGASKLSGGVEMTIHTHSNDDPEFSGLLFDSDRLSYNFVQGEDFSYSSRTCDGRAPFNDLGLNFTPDYPGVDDDADDTAAVRHHVEGTVSQVHGDRGMIVGTITTVLCETVLDGNGNPVIVDGDPVRVETTSQIVSEFRVKYTRVSNDALAVDGRFKFSPTESTGTFEDIKGQGTLQGAFTCLGTTNVCADRGFFTDFVVFSGDPNLPAGQLQPGLVGTFQDKTVEPIEVAGPN